MTEEQVFMVLFVGGFISAMVGAVRFWLGCALGLLVAVAAVNLDFEGFAMYIGATLAIAVTWQWVKSEMDVEDR